MGITGLALNLGAVTAVLVGSEARGQRILAINLRGVFDVEQRLGGRVVDVELRQRGLGRGRASQCRTQQCCAGRHDDRRLSEKTAPGYVGRVRRLLHGHFLIKVIGLGLSSSRVSLAIRVMNHTLRKSQRSTNLYLRQAAGLAVRLAVRLATACAPHASPSITIATTVTKSYKADAATRPPLDAPAGYRPV